MYMKHMSSSTQFNHLIYQTTLFVSMYVCKYIYIYIYVLPPPHVLRCSFLCLLVRFLIRFHIVRQHASFAELYSSFLLNSPCKLSHETILPAASLCAFI